MNVKAVYKNLVFFLGGSSTLIMKCSLAPTSPELPSGEVLCDHLKS